MSRFGFSRLSSLLSGHARKQLRPSDTTINTIAAANRSQHRTTFNASPRLHPYDYTAGRWLKDDILQRQLRHVDFNFAELCNKAMSLCPNAHGVENCEKQEGGFSRVFLFTMDNGERIVAKLPTSVAGPRRLTTNSEVATMAYIKSRTTIPVPRVLAWSDDDTNPIGAEYIFMEHAVGLQLHGCWDAMNSYDHLQLIKDVSKMIKQMATLKFPAYGSLYFADAPFDLAKKEMIDDDFCIGPHCGMLYWNTAPGESFLYSESSTDHGPWLDLGQYCDGLISSATSRIPAKAPEGFNRVPFHGSVEDHSRLLKDTAEVITSLANTPIIRDVSQPTLLHPDLHKRNIFVSDTDSKTITTIIDWQSTSIEPAFIYANETPDFAARATNSANEKIFDDNQSHKMDADAKATKDILLCSDAFEVCMKGFAPTLGAARAVDDTLLRPFRHCNTSWRDGITAGRQHILELSQTWHDLGLPGECPYQPSQEEISAHEKCYEDFETAQMLKLGTMQTLGTDSDGWVAADAWDEVKAVHDKMFWRWMDTAAEMGEAKARSLWPFDPPHE